MPAKGQKLGPQIPAKPFADWLNERFKFYEDQLRYQSVLRGSMLNFGNGPAQKVCEEIGWPGDGGVRKLHRYRHQLMCGSVQTRKLDRHTEFFPRYVVEEALHRAGVGMWELYPDYVVDIELEPDRWCPVCEEIVTPIDGFCPWDETRVTVQDHRRAA